MASLTRLTRQQKVFCLEYIIDHNGKRAAIAAGYSPHSAESQASRLLRNPLVKAELDKHEAELQKRLDVIKERTIRKLEVSVEKVLQDIAETVERCKQSYPVVDKDGEPVTVETPDGMAVAYKFDPANVLKGCELLGKHLKMFVERVEHTGVNEQAAAMTDAELARKLLGNDPRPDGTVQK